ncbi:recombinase family protein [Mycobacterium sp. SM1]|uniref:recombinase family protein n=1 Tax=Mycobacterium sp. SM1 TaxID=2816243 RepID=UPI001BD089B0|nr:recombinase family protein [Mycobacterium sp. SM1]MBS4730535.1 recombinase family protein [Mycobacterium sp. SM1]
MAHRGPDDYVSATAAAYRLGVSTRTLRRYTQEGRLPDARSAGGRRIFRIADLDAIGHKPPADGGRMVGYARVSSRRQQVEGDLDRQVAGLKEFGGADLVVFTDVASGLSDRRAGLRKALAECMKPAVTVLLVEHPDRLARFGVGVIRALAGRTRGECDLQRPCRLGRFGAVGTGARHDRDRDQLRRPPLRAALSQSETITRSGERRDH